MRHIKTYEKFDDDFVFLQQAKFWKNIFQKGDKLYINLYKLSDEMFEFANKERETKKFSRGGYSIPDDKTIISDMDDQYRKIIRKLLTNKVISFDDSDSGSHFGICFNVSFESGPTGFPVDEYVFQFEYLAIKLEGDDEYYNVDDEVIVHLDIDPEQYKLRTKFNL